MVLLGIYRYLQYANISLGYAADILQIYKRQAKPYELYYSAWC